MDLPRSSPEYCTPMSTSPLLAAEGLWRRFGNRVAVAEVSLSLAQGEVVGLLGLNGAGKSTLLQMLAGVVAPDHGRVRVAGEDLASASRAARRHLGYLPQNPPLHNEMGVAPFLEFCARLHGVPVAALREAVARALAQCGLESVAGRRIGNLSGGYRQRVGIAQAIVHAPPLVLLDEPTQGLDPAQSHAVRSVLASLRGRHGVLLSTHLLNEAEAVCDRVLVLHEGRVVHDGPVVDSSPRWVLRLGEAPPVSELTAITGPGVDALGAGCFLLPDALTPEALTRLVGLAQTRWQLQALERGVSSLEGRFMALVRDRTPAEAGA